MEMQIRKVEERKKEGSIKSFPSIGSDVDAVVLK